MIDIDVNTSYMSRDILVRSPRDVFDVFSLNQLSSITHYTQQWLVGNLAKLYFIRVERVVSGSLERLGLITDPLEL